jgi:hypothetical protein
MERFLSQYFKHCIVLCLYMFQESNPSASHLCSCLCNRSFLSFCLQDLLWVFESDVWTWFVWCLDSICLYFCYSSVLGFAEHLGSVVGEYFVITSLNTFSSIFSLLLQALQLHASQTIWSYFTALKKLAFSLSYNFRNFYWAVFNFTDSSLDCITSTHKPIKGIFKSRITCFIFSNISVTFLYIHISNHSCTEILVWWFQHLLYLRV